MIERLTKREKTIFILCLTTVSIFVSYKIVFGPLMNKIKQVETDIEKQQDQLIKNIHLIKNAEGLTENSKVYIDRFKQTESNEQVMSSMISEIEESASQLKLPISEIKPKVVRKENYVNRFAVSLTMDSSWVDVLKLIHSLQQEPHFFDIEEIVFQKGSAVGIVRTQWVLEKMSIPAFDGQKQKIVLPQIQGEELKADHSISSKQDVVLSAAKPFSFYENTFKDRDLFLMPWEHLQGTQNSSNTALPQLCQLIKVAGIMLDHDSKAIVEDAKTKEIYFLSEGEDILGAIVKQIREDKVVFMYNGEIIEMGVE